MEPLLERAGQRAAEVERQAAQDIERFASQQVAEAEATEGFASVAEVAAAGAETAAAVETGGALTALGVAVAGAAGAATGGLVAAGAAAAMVGTAWVMEGGVNAASHMLGWGAETGGGTDSDASRAPHTTDVQTLNSMQESGAIDHFVYRIDTDSESEPQAQPQQQIRARPIRRQGQGRQQPTPFGINQVPIPVSSDSDRISRQSRSDRGPLGTQGSARPFAQPSLDALRQASEPEAGKEMENVTQAVQDELVKSLDYKLGSSNVNYIQSRRDVQYFPSSLSTFTPTTSRVARIPLTSGMDFIDPESLKIAFRVRNNDATLDLNPGTQEPSCFIKRVQLFANGQRCDDISEYGRCCFLYSLLKSSEWYKNKGITGFWELAGLVPAPIPATNYKDVLMAPMLIGMFQAGKFLPPQLNLVLELEFAEPADALRPGGGSTDYSIENVRVLASQVTLDSALYESYQKILLSGRSLVFAYPTMHTQVSSIPAGSTSHNVTVARAFTKLLGAFVSFRDIDDANLGECSNFEHPGDGSQFSTSPLESQMQLGALQYPRTPMVSDAEHFHFLEILAGTYDSSIKNMRIADNLWNNTQFIAAFPVERVPKHPLSGISTRSGDLARFTFKGMVADRVQRMYIHLLSYQIVTVSGSGVSVLD